MKREKRAKWIIAGIAFSLLVICVVVYNVMPDWEKERVNLSEYGKDTLDSPKSQPKKSAKKATETIDWKTIERVVKSLTEDGLIKKIDLGARNVWVDTMGWTLINAETKENFARTLAFYCAHKAGDELYFADVYDWQSGKKVAKYDAFGFKVY